MGLRDDYLRGELLSERTPLPEESRSYVKDVKSPTVCKGSVSGKHAPEEEGNDRCEWCGEHRPVQNPGVDEWRGLEPLTFGEPEDEITFAYNRQWNPDF